MFSWASIRMRYFSVVFIPSSGIGGKNAEKSKRIIFMKYEKAQKSTHKNLKKAQKAQKYHVLCIRHSLNVTKRN